VWLAGATVAGSQAIPDSYGYQEQRECVVSQRIANDFVVLFRIKAAITKVDSR
jgi:hypothetical protein